MAGACDGNEEHHPPLYTGRSRAVTQLSYSMSGWSDHLSVKIILGFYGIFQMNMQRRLFSFLSQPPVKFVSGVLGEEINCVCPGWRALQ